MKKNIKIGIIVGVILLIIAIVGGYLFFNDIMQKSKMIVEFEQIKEMTQAEDLDLEKLKEKTSNIVSSGKYATVEKAAKNYASDVFSKAFEIKTLLQDEKIAQLLTASNYTKDGPEFVESKKYLSETKQKLEEGKTQMLSYFEESKINSYIEAETTNGSAIQLYQEFLSQDIKMSDSEKREIETSIDKVVSMLGIQEEVINFLVQNKGNWQVQGDKIVFHSNSLVTAYNAFLTRLRIL